MKKVGFFLGVLFLFLLTLPSNLLAYDKSFERVGGFTHDTGNMNERDDIRRFSGSFTLSTKSANADDYKVDGIVKPINVAVYISWKNNGNFERVFTDSFIPVDSDGNVIPSQNINFSCKNPVSWANPMRVIIVAMFNATPSSSPQISYNGRGDILQSSVQTPPALADVQLGNGSTSYEGLKSFNGSLGEVDIKTGSAKVKFRVLVEIFKNPLGGAYDPVPEEVAVYVDLNGGTKPTTLIFNEQRLAGSYWVSAGIMPALPFDLPFDGEWLAGPEIPGVIVGGSVLVWGDLPNLGSDTTWGQQNRYVWNLPPRTIEFTPDFPKDPSSNDIPTFTIYDGCSFGGTARVLLRKLQIESRVNGIKWDWGDGIVDNSDLIPGKLQSHKSHVYKLKNPTVGETIRGNCSVKYQNSDTVETSLEYPFQIVIKPLPSIYVPTGIEIKDSEGKLVAYPGEDVLNTYEGTGVKRLVCYEGYTNNYKFYYKITDDSVTSTINTVPPTSSRIKHRFAKLGQKTLKLFVHYKKAGIQGNKLVDLGWVDVLVAQRTVNVESQQVMEDENKLKIAFKATVDNATPKVMTNGHYHLERTLTLAEPTASIKFNGIANIFYARRIENNVVEELDQFSGVASDSVYYRWRVLDPNGNDAFANGLVKVSDEKLMKFTKIPGYGTSIEGITVTFKTPFGTSKKRERFYKVFIEAKYKELAWKPVYVAGKIISWEKVLNYKNNYKTRYIGLSPMVDSEYSSSNANIGESDVKFYTSASSEPVSAREGSGANMDLLGDGTLGWEVRINDQIPSKMVLTAPKTGTTGDKVHPQQGIVVMVYDNNPDTELKYVRARYQRFMEKEYRMSPLMDSNVNWTSAIGMFPYKNIEDYIATFKQKTMNSEQHNEYNSQLEAKKKDPNLDTPNFVFTSLNNYSSLSSETGQIPFYDDAGSWFPNSFATSMDQGSGANKIENPGVFEYTISAYVDDGDKHYVTDSGSITITDNDVPNVKVTLVDPETGVPTIYEISGGFNDPLPDDAPLIERVIHGDTEVSLKTKEVADDSTIDVGHKFVAFAHQRFICNIEVRDNVLPKSGEYLAVDSTLEGCENPQAQMKAYLKQTGPGVYKSENPIQLFYMKPGDYNMVLKVKDKSNKGLSIKIPLGILKEKPSTVRVLKQNNEK